MESIHGIDVSWIHNTHNKGDIHEHERGPHSQPRLGGKSTVVTQDNYYSYHTIELLLMWLFELDHPRNSRDQASGGENTPQPRNGTKVPQISTKAVQNAEVQQSKEATATPPKQVSQRPGYIRRNSPTERLSVGAAKLATPSPGTGRRNSWLSSISSKFSSSPGGQPAQHNAASPAAKQPVAQEEQPLRPLNPPRFAVLPHGVKPDGAAPYTPAPPKSGQPNFLQSALRRLSSSGGQLSAAGKGVHYGLCERRVLNVDTHRERCQIPELDQSKLRRVAFCVDVEIAGGPRYKEDEGEDRKKEKRERKRMVEKGEGEALKNPHAVRDDKENYGILKATGEELPKEPEREATEVLLGNNKAEKLNDKDTTKKKEKKKRSEEERKARKERKRKLAEANGTLPVELVMNGSDSSLEDSAPPTGPGTPKTQAAPTTDPVRIYRRCCQLRETPILKKITEQLASPTNCGIETPGVVSKLDLSSYWLQLSDLATLGDYLAVVPVKELVMENCGLTDEGVRVILAGLLAAKPPDLNLRRKHRMDKDTHVVRHGCVVERVVFKNNTKIGRDGWGYISLFICMSRSLKSMDLSMIPFPQPTTPSNGAASIQTGNTMSVQADAGEIFAKALTERLGGAEFELLNMAETGLTTDQLGTLVDAVIKSGLRRLGLAGNEITADGMAHVARYLKQGKCEGLDLGGIDLKDLLGVVAESLDENHPLWALSLANCELTPDSLCKLFPALAKLKNFRFIDLSHNHDLFATEPSALSLLRRYVPKMPLLKRIHLTDVSMTPEQAIALAEILPESPGLAHVNIMENPKLSALANALDEVNQEEACALYASLMAAVRVSKTLICIDIEVPSAESSEVVKALAKQVVAYCLRNMERGPVAEIAEAAASILEPHVGEKEVFVPDVLLHLVGHVEGFHENHDEDDPAPDDDYVIGGTGVVKALGICLRNNTNDSMRPSNSESETSGTSTPNPVRGGKAKDMSKNLLGSARKIRARLQPALVKEARIGDRNAYNRLVFLDQTLERMIKRFEDEYPETRLPSTVASPLTPGPANVSPSESALSAILDAQGSDTEPILADAAISDDEDTSLQHTLSRHNSDVSLASKALSQEEGRMHRFGQELRRDLLKPETEDHEHGTTGKETWAPHLEMLRGMIDDLGGDEIRKKVEEGGQEAVMRELTEEASALRQQMISIDPEGWEKFREAQEAAQLNMKTQG